MKLHRWENERYPDYSLCEPSDIFGKANVEVSDYLYARYKKVVADYEAVQEEIANLKELSDD
mgnify:CR=1 FL=1